MSKKYTSLEHTARLIHEGKTNLLNPQKNAGGQSPAYTEKAGYTGVFKSKSQNSSAAAGRARSMPYTSGATMTEDGYVPNEGNATPTSKAYGSFDEDGGKKKKSAKMENAPPDMGGVSAQLNTEDGKKKLKKESLSTMGGQGNETGEYGRNLSAEDGGKKKRLKEDGDEDMIKQSRAALNAATDPAEKEKLQQKHDRLLSTVDRIPSNSNQQSFEDGGKKKRLKEGIIGSALKMGGRLGAKIVPGLGQGLSAADAASRYASGDTTGAVISAAGAIPYIGSVAGPVGDVVNTIRDVTGMSAPSKSNDDTEASGMPALPGPSAPQTTTPKTSSGNQSSPKRLNKTVKEEARPDYTRRKDSSKELVGRPDSAGVKNPKSVLGRNASIKDKIISENKKLASIVKRTKEETGNTGKRKTYDYGNVEIEFNPPLKKPPTDNYNN